MVICMKKIIVVSKTHLDLGFTDYAKNVYDKYLNEYIPGAVSLANEMNTESNKKFIWTTGSWIIKEALKNSTLENKEKLINALKCGNIVPHALPFTTHTELLDENLAEYAISIVDDIDKIRGKKTIAAKMTDVPGHTKALIPYLQRHGIKLLHIGVNGSSALADVPPCFLWRYNGCEVVVIYSGDYGGAFSCDLIEEVLYFDHTLDNRGTPLPEKITEKLNKIANEFPGYEVQAGTMDEIAQLLWEKRDKLPVVTSEIGDTWIHGSASDTYKSAALRELMALKKYWLAENSMAKGSEEYNEFCDALLCIAEHTCGMDMKKYFADYEHYLKHDFQKAKEKDVVKIHHPFRDFPQNIYTIVARHTGEYKHGSYKTAQNSLSEQRLYIDKAVNALNRNHKEKAIQALGRLIAGKPVESDESFNIKLPIICGNSQLKINEYGGIEFLSINGVNFIEANENPIIEYRSFAKADYDFWLSHYSRNHKENKSWLYGDFGRPLLKYVDGKYPTGRYFYIFEKAEKFDNSTGCCIVVTLKCEQRLCKELGAPKTVQITYKLSKYDLKFNVSWFEKDANRLTEAIYLHLYPQTNQIMLKKLGGLINPFDVVGMGAKKLHAVQSVQFEKKGKTVNVYNFHSPLFSLGKGKILEFDDKYENPKKDGVSFVLYDNVWGTNFPLWYSENASFDFVISE